MKIFQKDTGGTLTTNLVSYYKLEDVNDFFSSNNLTNNGSVGFGSGKVNNAAILNNPPSKYFSKSSPAGVPTGNHDLSISGWVYHLANQSSGIPGFLTFGTESNYQMAGFGFGAPGANGLYWLGYNNDANTTWNYSTGVWYMVTATYTAATKTVQFYVNGAAQGSGLVLPNTPNFGSVFLEIGAQRPGNIVGLNAYVDEIGLWSKVLSSTEISDLYNGGAGQTMIYGQTLTEAVTNTDTLLRGLYRSFTEAVTNTDTLLRGLYRSFTEAVTNTDTLLRGVYKNFTESITNSDIFSGVKVVFQLFTEAVQSTDTLIKTIGKNFSEAVQNTDNLIKGIYKNFTEAVTNSDTLNIFKAIFITLTESVKSTASLWLNGMFIDAWWTKRTRAVIAWTKRIIGSIVYTKRNKPQK
jgi:hypothetical protein